MPEATVNEDRFLAARKDNVGIAGKITAVKTEAKAKCMQKLADEQFRLCVDLPDSRHPL
jgi:hypothetical protein